MRPSVTEPPAAPPAVGFSAWPPLPPLPLLARSPPQDAVFDHSLPRLDPNLSRDLNEVQSRDIYRNQQRRQFESPDCELIVLTRVSEPNVKFQNSKIMTRRKMMKTSDEQNCSMRATVDMNSTIDYDPQLDNYCYDFPTQHTSVTQDRSSYVASNSFLNCSSKRSSTDDILDLDSFMNCDITSLDAYVHDDTIQTSYVDQSVYPSGPSSSDYTSAPSTASFESALNSPEVDQDPIDEFFPELAHQNKSSKVTRTRKPSTVSTVSSDGSGTSDYRLKRDKNNVSSQKSRAKRQEKIQTAKLEKERLEKRQVELKAMTQTLEQQVQDYKRMVMMFVHKR